MGLGARGHEKFSQQMNKVRSKDSKKFSCRNRKFKRFFRPKTSDLQKKKVFSKIARDFPPEIGNSSGVSGWKQVISKKKKGLHPKNVIKSGVSPQKTPIWAPSLLISSGHSPRLGGGHNFRLGGHKQSLGGARPRYAPRGAGSAGMSTKM